MPFTQGSYQITTSNIKNNKARFFPFFKKKGYRRENPAKQVSLYRECAMFYMLPQLRKTIPKSQLFEFKMRFATYHFIAAYEVMLNLYGIPHTTIFRKTKEISHQLKYPARTTKIKLNHHITLMGFRLYQT